MRHKLHLFTAGLVLAAATQAFAATPPDKGSMSGTATGAAPSDSQTAPPSSQSSPDSATPDTGNSANPAASAGANTSATAGGFTVGEPVKDNTGTTIGEIASLSPAASGGQMAVIKMGTDSFQVQTDRLGSANGAATINLTQTQIQGMLHSSSSSAPASASTPK